MKDLEKMFDEALIIVKENIGEDKLTRKIYRPITINTRAKRRWGRCTSSNDGERARIEISSRILRDDVPDKATMEVIIHEILHACKDGMSHTGVWKKYANIISEKTEYKITRTSAAEKFGLKEEQLTRQYVVMCEKCGVLLRRARKVSIIKNPTRYIHRSCGGHFTQLNNN